MARSAVDRSDSEFQRSLVIYRDKLVARAAGRTCGGCRFFLSGGLCVEQDIEIHRKQAIACQRHRRRRKK